MVDTLPQQGVLRVIPPGALDRMEANKAKEAAAAQDAAKLSDVAATNLAGFVRSQFEMMRNHRGSAAGWSATAGIWRGRDTNVLVIAAVITVRKPIPSNITSAARSCPETFDGTLSPYPTVVTVWTAHHRPDPRVGKLS